MVQRFVNTAAWAWVIAIAFFGVGDLLTTGFGVGLPTISEGNPFVSTLLHDYGVGGLFLLKLGAFGVAGAMWYSLDHPIDVGVPLSLSVVGLGLTTWNLWVLGLVPLF